MTVTPASLRALYPEFADPARHTDATINQWLGVAVNMLDAGRWGALLDFGTTLFVCHRLALGARAARVARIGGIPGQASGPVQSKSVDKVSESFDTSSAVEEGGGHWNLTIYGQEYLRQARIVGAGPTTVGLEIGNSPTGVYAGPYNYGY